MTARSAAQAVGYGHHRAVTRNVAARTAVIAVLATLVPPSQSAQASTAFLETPMAADRREITKALRPTFDTTRPLQNTNDTPIIDVSSFPMLKLPGAWPAIEIRTILIGLHLLGLSFGLGGATMLDFWIFRWVRWGYLPENVVRTFEFVSKAVSVGLLLLWLSGLGFLMLYGHYDPLKLTNPKILAKLIIVGVLSINGIVIHRIVLPYVVWACRMPLFDGFRRLRRILFILSGALSGLSWYSAFSLGIIHEFNGRVPALAILGIWLTLAILLTMLLEVFFVLKPIIRPLISSANEITS